MNQLCNDMEKKNQNNFFKLNYSTPRKDAKPHPGLKQKKKKTHQSQAI